MKTFKQLFNKTSTKDLPYQLGDYISTYKSVKNLGTKNFETMWEVTGINKSEVINALFKRFNKNNILINGNMYIIKDTQGNFDRPAFFVDNKRLVIGFELTIEDYV